MWVSCNQAGIISLGADKETWSESWPIAVYDSNKGGRLW